MWEMDNLSLPAVAGRVCRHEDNQEKENDRERDHACSRGTWTVAGEIPDAVMAFPSGRPAAGPARSPLLTDHATGDRAIVRSGPKARLTVDIVG
jgi:hypothetical protein